MIFVGASPRGCPPTDSRYRRSYMTSNIFPILMGSEIQRDRSEVQVVLDALPATLPAETGVLDAAERGGGLGHQAPVQAHHPDLERLGDAERPADVPGVEVG